MKKQKDKHKYLFSTIMKTFGKLWGVFKIFCIVATFYMGCILMFFKYVNALRFQNRIKHLRQSVLRK